MPHRRGVQVAVPLGVGPGMVFEVMVPEAPPPPLVAVAVVMAVPVAVVAATVENPAAKD